MFSVVSMYVSARSDLRVKTYATMQQTELKPPRKQARSNTATYFNASTRVKHMILTCYSLIEGKDKSKMTSRESKSLNVNGNYER